MGSGIGMLGMNCRFLGLVAGDELWDAGIGQPQIPGDGGTYSDRLIAKGTYSQRRVNIENTPNDLIFSGRDSGPQCDRQGTTCSNGFNLILAVVFLTSEKYSLSHTETSGISEHVPLCP